MGKYFIKEKKAHFYVYCIIRQVQSIRHVRSSCSDVLPQGGQGKGVSLVYVITFGRSGFINSVLPQNINILSFDHPDITKWFKPLNKDVGSRMVRKQLLEGIRNVFLGANCGWVPGSQASPHNCSRRITFMGGSG